ncbi:MAG: SPFH domain-containing protein [Lachnospiraceae bacterium]|jgi:regulator of protease activity HflC (stomatin/prohibitin superfamily)|nr:SPFH domain-containing protein [Lachnospiraceae bacterium]
MEKKEATPEAKIVTEEVQAKYLSGMPCLLLNLTVMLGCLAVFILAIMATDDGANPMAITLICVSALYAFVIGPILLGGLKILAPNEAYVLTIFGKYYGTLRGPGFFQVNPFATPVVPACDTSVSGASVGASGDKVSLNSADIALSIAGGKKKISLKAMTLSNDMQKINDQRGNPIIIGIVVIWKVTNTAQAIFNVDNYKEFLSIQCDAALRNIVRLYPYDNVGSEKTEDCNEVSLRGSSDEIALRLQEEIQAKVAIAGLVITEARITNLSYAPEIAAAMLQRQQASAVVDARHMIVDGAVGMVEMALARLSKANIVTLDEERKAAMVSNLLVVLCGNRDAQPVVNSGSLY